jgi:hypothetical protein
LGSVPDIAGQLLYKVDSKERIKLVNPRTDNSITSRYLHPFSQINTISPRTLTLNYYIMSTYDEWPKMPDGCDFDGKQLLTLVRNGTSPFPWDVNLLIQEVEEKLGTRVIDIPSVYSGSNNYVRSYMQ